MTYSNEQLVMDEMMAAMALRLYRGIDVRPETIARGVIEEVGPMGENYLTRDHTLRFLGSEEYLTPHITVSGPFAVWKDHGAPDSYELARRAVSHYATLPVPELEESRRRRITEIIEGF